MAEESTIACAAPDEQEKPQEPKVMNLSEAHGVAKVDKEADSRRTLFLEGFHDGIPIALGYFVVSFTLGIAARNAGLDPLQGFLASFFNNASAGEYAGFTVIEADAPYLEIVLITLVANARYMLMSCALSQKFQPGTSIWHRIFVGFDVTDEIFGITIARKGPLNPYYNYGAMALALPGWAVGTSLGVVAGNILPPAVVSALSVALYGMFLWVIIPPAKKNRIVGGLVLASFALSYLASILPGIASCSSGTRTIILTVLIAGIGAALFPIREPQGQDGSQEGDDRHAA